MPDRRTNNRMVEKSNRLSESDSSSSENSGEMRRNTIIHRYCTTRNDDIGLRTDYNSDNSNSDDSRLYLHKHPVVHSGDENKSVTNCTHSCKEQKMDNSDELKATMDFDFEERHSSRVDSNSLKNRLNPKRELERPGRTSMSTSSAVMKQNLAEKISNDMALATVMHRDLPRQPKSCKKKQKKLEKPVYQLYAFQCVEFALRKALWHWGKLVGVYSTMLMILPFSAFLLSLLCLFLNRHLLVFEPPFSSLYSPPILPTIDTRHHISFYPVEFNGSDPIHGTLNRQSPSEFAFLFETIDKEDTVFEMETMKLYVKLMTKLERIEVGFGKSIYSWEQLCRWRCNKRGVVEQLMARGTTVVLTYPETIFDSSGEGNASRVFLGTTVGGVETDMDGVISRAKALAHYVQLIEEADGNILADWDLLFRQIMNDVRTIANNRGLKLFWWSYGAFLDTVSSAIKELYIWLTLSVISIIVLTTLLYFVNDSYRSRPWLGLTTGFMIILCSFEGFFIHLVIVDQLEPFVFVTIFITAGIALLSTVSLLQSWRKYSNAAVHPVEKLAFVLSWDGPCVVSTIFLLSTTYSILGVTTTVPYLRCLFLILAASLFLLLLFVLFLFTVVFHHSGRRETKGVKWYRFWEQGDTHFAMPMMRNFDESHLILVHAKLLNFHPSFTRVLGSNLTNFHGRYLSLLLVILYVTFATWGCSIVQIDLKEDHFIPVNSDSAKYLSKYHSLFGHYEQYLELKFDQILDYNNLNTRRDIQALLHWAQEKQFATKSVSWLDDFARFERSSIYVVNQDTFVPVVNLVFLTTEPYQRYISDIVFDKYQSQIIGSRMYLEMSVVGINQRLSLINGLLSLAKKHDLPLNIRCPFVFSLEHDLQVVSTVFVTCSLSFGLFAAFSLVLFARPALTFSLFTTVVSVVFGIVGFSSIWSIPLNMVTFGVVIASNSLTIAISLQFCYHYSVNSRSSLDTIQRIEYSLQSCFFPAVSACFAPIFAYFPLFFFTDVPIVLAIGKILTLSSLLGLGHLLLVLPGLMLFSTEIFPRFFFYISSVCEQSFCFCCNPEEDSGSIYYIPTVSRRMDAQALRRFVSSHYSSLPTAPLPLPTAPSSLPPAYLLPPSPPSAAISPTSLKMLCPDLLPHYRLPAIQQQNVDSESIYRRHERNKSQEYDNNDSRIYTGTGVSRASSGTVTKRNFGAQMDEESIYEEPPSTTEIYSSKNRPIHEKHGQNFDQIDRYNFDERQNLETQVENLPLNWRRYLLDGSILQKQQLQQEQQQQQPVVPSFSSPAFFPPPNSSPLVRHVFGNKP